MAQRHEAWQIVAGEKVLLAQAYNQFQLWKGREAPTELMIEAIVAHERRESHGYQGSHDVNKTLQE